MNTKIFALLSLVASADALSAAVPGTSTQAAVVAPPPVAPAPVEAAPVIKKVQTPPAGANPTVQARAPQPLTGKTGSYGGTMSAQRLDRIGPDIYAPEGRIAKPQGSTGGDLLDMRFDTIDPNSIYGSATEYKN